MFHHLSPSRPSPTRFRTGFWNYGANTPALPRWRPCSRKLHQEDPKHLFQALLALSKTPLETRRTLVPLLANALTLWPDAEGCDVFPIANAYGQMDLPSAAQWAAAFLGTTGRSDLAVANLIGQFAGTSESQALAMIDTLPDAARTAALQDADCFFIGKLFLPS